MRPISLRISTSCKPHRQPSCHHHWKRTCMDSASSSCELAKESQLSCICPTRRRIWKIWKNNNTHVSSFFTNNWYWNSWQYLRQVVSHCLSPHTTTSQRLRRAQHACKAWLFHPDVLLREELHFDFDGNSVWVSKDGVALHKSEVRILDPEITHCPKAW